MFRLMQPRITISKSIQIKTYFWLQSRLLKELETMHIDLTYKVYLTVSHACAIIYTVDSRYLELQGTL